MLAETLIFCAFQEKSKTGAEKRQSESAKIKKFSVADNEIF